MKLHQLPVLFATLIALAASNLAGAKEPATLKDKSIAYAKPELLVDIDDLSKQIETGKLVLLDARSKADFERGHLPGAQWVDVAKWKAGFGQGTDKTAWSERIGKTGIDGKTRIVVYDHALTGSAARIWWILRYWGVDDASLANGGVQAWEEAGHKLTNETPRVDVKKFVAKPHGELLTTYTELKAHLSGEGSKVDLLDTRTDREFSGGKIGVCEHLDWQELVDKKTGKMRSAKELKVLFDRVGFDPNQPTVTYCQSGGRASVMAFALELMGGKKVSNYYGSWGEWSKKEKP